MRPSTASNAETDCYDRRDHLNTTFSKGTLMRDSVVALKGDEEPHYQELKYQITTLQTTYDFLNRRLTAQEDGHKDLLRVVKLL